MEAGPGPAYLPGEHRQRDEAACVVGAVYVLRDAHAPQDHRGTRLGEEPRHGANDRSVDAADGRHCLRAERGDVLLQRIVAARAVMNERLRSEPFFDDRMHHRIQQRDIGVRLELQIVGRVPGELRTTRIGENQLRATLDGVLHPRRGNRMIDDRIRADEQHDFRLQHVHHRIGNGARADSLEQRRDARRVTQPGAMVDVVRSEAGAYELLKEICFLV